MRLPLLLAVAAKLIASPTAASAAGQPPSADSTALPEIRVDYFGAEKGYAEGVNTVPILCVVRNVGKSALAANTLRVRCYTLAGLDYTEGELTPLVPALAPGQAASFRWRLQPTDRSNSLVASVLITRVEDKSVRTASVSPVVAPGTTNAGGAVQEIVKLYMPRAVLSVIPHLHGLVPPITGGFTLPNATSTPNAGSARIGNEHLLLRIMPTASHGAVVIIAAKSPDGWGTAGAASSLVEIQVAADGQLPWWRAFKWSQSDVRTDLTGATLTLTGTCGDDFEATITLQTRKDSSAIDGKVRLKARRTSRLFSIQLPRLDSATDRSRPLPPLDGSSALIGTSAPDNGDLPNSVAAAHRGMVTAGLSWSEQPPLAEWVPFALPQGDTDHTVQLGMRWNSGERGEVVLPGGIIECNFRIFAYAPSDSIRDARKFAIP